MDFLKGFDIEKVAGSVAQGFSALDEFPAPAPAEQSSKVVVTASGANKARQTALAWSDLDFEGHKQEWSALCSELSQLQSKGGATDTRERWQERAKSSEYQLLKLCNVLLALPDPVPVLSNASGLSNKIVEIEVQNRQLQATAEAAAADSKEVTALVEAHRALEAQHKELQESVARREQELSELRQAASETATARSEATAHAAEVVRLQGLLKSLREDHEAAQGQLFDVANRHDLDDGNRQRELEVALEEVEALTQRCAELEMDRSNLASKLQAATAAAATAAGSGLRTGAAEDGADGWEADGEWGGAGSGNGGAGATGGAAGGALPSGDGFWERQLRMRADQVVALEAQVEAAGREAAEVVARHDAQLRAAANQLSAAQLAVSRLQAELGTRPAAADHAELRARADALQQLVDVQVESEGWNKDFIRQPLGALGTNPQATQTLLQERNRALSSELAATKRLVTERTTELSSCHQQLKALQGEAAQRESLVQRLEGDLASVKAMGTKGGALGASDHRPALSLNLPLAPSAGLGAAGQGTAPLEGEGSAGLAEGELVQPSTPPASDGGGGGGSSLLDILVLQRDRFRQRVGQLEEEKGALAQELADSRRQLDTLRSDNVGLYEKLRYLEQYSQKALSQGAAQGGRTRTTVLKVDQDGVALQEAADTRGHRYQCGPLSFEIAGGAAKQQQQQQAGPGAPGAGVPGAAGVRSRGGKARAGAGLCFPDDVDEEQGAGPEARYTKAYEARVNPFTEFQQKEVDNRVRGLQLHERAVLAGGKILVGSRFGRAFLAVYALLLHLFILVLLYYAMAPRSRIVEIVDSAELAQRQAAATAGTAEVAAVKAAAGAAGGAAAAVVKPVAAAAARRLLAAVRWFGS